MRFFDETVIQRGRILLLAEQLWPKTTHSGRSQAGWNAQTVQSVYEAEVLENFMVKEEIPRAGCNRMWKLLRNGVIHKVFSRRRSVRMRGKDRREALKRGDP